MRSPPVKEGPNPLHWGSDCLVRAIDVSWAVHSLSILEGSVDAASALPENFVKVPSRLFLAAGAQPDSFQSDRVDPVHFRGSFLASLSWSSARRFCPLPAPRKERR